MNNFNNYVELEVGGILNLKRSFYERLTERKKEINYVLTLLNKKDKTQILSILIGKSGAQSIAVEIEKMELPVQTLESLFKNVLESFEIKLDYVLITEIDDKGFYKSKVKLTHNEKSTELYGRTTDLLILALKHKRPIYIEREEFEKLTTK
jgi:bifunctional DNase/RNase